MKIITLYFLLEILFWNLFVESSLSAVPTTNPTFSSSQRITFNAILSFMGTTCANIDNSVSAQISIGQTVSSIFGIQVSDSQYVNCISVGFNKSNVTSAAVLYSKDPKAALATAILSLSTALSSGSITSALQNNDYNNGGIILSSVIVYASFISNPVITITTINPTLTPTTFKPSSFKPSSPPTKRPTTFKPSLIPSRKPSIIPSRKPSRIPSIIPSRKPSIIPSRKPSIIPTKKQSVSPTRYPTLTFKPSTNIPSKKSTSVPASSYPTDVPTDVPTITK